MQENSDLSNVAPQLIKPSKPISTEQALRIKRLGMSCGSYVFTFALVCFCWIQGLITFDKAVHYGVYSVLLNLSFFVLIKTDLNLRFFADPSLTLIQISTSILPSFYVMYYLDPGQARSVFLYIGIVPALYGIMALNTRQFVLMGIWFVLSYCTLIGIMKLNRPHVLDESLELIQLLALILVLMQLAWIGGYINELRRKLRKQNKKLQSTTVMLSESVEQVSELARRDELTGLYNRRHIFDVLNNESNRVRRSPGTFCVCIADIDFFKRVNDTYGHQAGDEVLCKVAQELEKSLRNIDCIGRYGGEEFLVILPQTDLSGGLIKSERMRKQVEQLSFPDIAEDFQITLSIGMTEHIQNESMDNTILRADEALYRAKDEGRNQVVSQPASIKTH
jgi:diguanylate cyclase (GGDEF)-like protein